MGNITDGELGIMTYCDRCGKNCSAELNVGALF